MAVEVWHRNPFKAITALAETGQRLFLTTEYDLNLAHVDLETYFSLHLGLDAEWRCMVIYYDAGLVQEIRKGYSVEKPFAVYPAWKYGEDLELLEELAYCPIGRDPDILFDKEIKQMFRPTPNQEHRIFVLDIPRVDMGEGKQIIKALISLQDEHPSCILHITNTQSYRVHFGLNFKAALIDVYAKAAGKEIISPGGQVLATNCEAVRPANDNKNKMRSTFKFIGDVPHQAKMLGFTVDQLVESRLDRMKYNVRSAEWAAQHYQSQIKVHLSAPDSIAAAGRLRRVVNDQINTPNSEYVPPETNRIFVKNNLPDTQGDKFHCDTCSLALDCRFYRRGAVCSVPGAEPQDLAVHFKTRDSERIIEGLGILMMTQTRRLEMGLENENITGELDKLTGDTLKTLFDQGVKLAKLVDPSLRGPSVQVNVGGGGDANVILGGNPKKMISEAIKLLEGQGFPRDQITPELIQTLINGQQQRSPAIRGELE